MSSFIKLLKNGFKRGQIYFLCGSEKINLTPFKTLVGLGGFERPTSPLSGVRSNQLSYRPEICSKNKFKRSLYANFQEINDLKIRKRVKLN